MNPVELSIFVSRMESVCDEMGSVLKRTAFSPNIKDRLDFSCAIFDEQGQLSAQAAHIPVHLGSMAFAMADLVSIFEWQQGDLVILNDPFLGGTHLPDVTIIAPVFIENLLKGFAVNRAHHANIGSDTPGSMPNSTRLEEEGIVISPRLLIRNGHFQKDCLPILEQLQTLDEAGNLSGDLAAQVSSVQAGAERLSLLIGEIGLQQFSEGLLELNNYGERLAQTALSGIPAGTYSFTDYLDDDGAGTVNIPISLTLTVSDEKVIADFDGTSKQVKGNVNCPLSVTAAAVFYVFRCLMPAHTPACAGIFRAIQLKAEPGSLVNAQYPAAVVAGNVETSMRLVDVVLGALAQALPEEIPAASQGTMNNIAMGQTYADGSRWDYYETLAGGVGASARGKGGSAMHSHMTNTLNTPIESVELHYPLQILRYGIREASGGVGKHSGGSGLIREYRFLEPAQVSLLTERREHQPWGQAEGKPGASGKNYLNGKLISGKSMFSVKAGDTLSIETPGGGAWGLSEIEI